MQFKDYKFKSKKEPFPDGIVPPTPRHCERPTGAWQSGAFSLVEMLMALLVASLLLAALAPVITKRLAGENVSFSDTGSSLIPKTSCARVNDTLSDMLLESETDGCKVPQNTYSASAIIVSGGGGGGGAVDKVSGAENEGGLVTGTAGGMVNTDFDSPLNAKTETFDIYEYMSDIRIELVSAGGIGGDGAASGGYPMNQADCGDWGVYVDWSQNTASNDDGSIQHSVCVSRYNPGEGRSGSPDIPSIGVTRKNVGETCETASSENCCWVGKTGGSDCEVSANGNTYSGCNRTVCQRFAAQTICTNYLPDAVSKAGGSMGRAPFMNELWTWKSYINTLNKQTSSFPGLQFCTIAQNSVGVACPPLWSMCKGAGEDACLSHAVWSSTPSSTNDGHYDLQSTSTGGWYWANNSGYTYSVRCVIDNISKFNPYRGGGGGAGASAKIKIPDEVIKKAYLNDDNTPYKGTLKLELTAGHGGNPNLRPETRGAGSSAQLKKDGKIIWGVWIFQTCGGGANATSTSHGSMGYTYMPESNTCRYQNIYDENYKTQKRVVCSAIGATVASTIGQHGSEGGAGGRAHWGGSNVANALGGGVSGNPDINGQDGGIGGGGGGATCKQGRTRNEPVCGKGGKGGPGAVRFTYKKTYPGAGGGGGGAGTLLHVKNFNVTPGAVIKLKVGKAGSGGIAGGNGTDGGSSYIRLSDNTVFEVSGGGGGRAATPANPDTNIYAKGGQAGSSSSVTTDTLNKNLKGAKYDVFPAQKDTTKGNSAPDNDINNGGSAHTSAGGNGGINSKISSLAGTSGVPCGGFSKSVIKMGDKEYQCGNEDYPTDSYVPLALSRVLSTQILQMAGANTIHNFAPGATGGGGGGWDATANAADTTYLKGANGLGGFIFIYFGDWGED